MTGGTQQVPSGQAAGPPSGCPAHANAVPLSDPRFHTDPTALYRELGRDHGPVVPVVMTGGLPAWLVMGYHELHQVTEDASLFSRDAGTWNQWHRVPADWALPPAFGPGQPSVLTSVGADHERRAGVVSEALGGVESFGLHRQAERLADDLIDGFCAAGEADLISQYARPLPFLVLAQLYGFADIEGRSLLPGGENGQDVPGAGHQRLSSAVSALLAARREDPANDVASRVLAHPAGLTDEELRQDLVAIMAGSLRPTGDWLGNTLRLVLSDERFVSPEPGGAGISDAMDEVLWEDTPNQNAAGRWATRDTELGGRHIRTGDLLLLGLGAANSDPRTRAATPGGSAGRTNASFSFGHGVHRCPFPAQEIAEVIARTGVDVLLDRLPELALVGPPEKLAWRPSPWSRGLAELPVSFPPTPPLDT